MRVTTEKASLHDRVSVCMACPYSRSVSFFLPPIAILSCMASLQLASDSTKPRISQSYISSSVCQSGKEAMHVAAVAEYVEGDQVILGRLFTGQTHRLLNNNPTANQQEELGSSAKLI